MRNQAMLEGFVYVKTRDCVSIKIYKSEDKTRFLRIGNKESLTKEVKLHKSLFQYGFPVPPIIAEGEEGQKAYYIERSLGEKHLGNIFRDEYTAIGKISDVHFDSLVLMSKRFVKAQLKTIQYKSDLESFYSGTLMPVVQKELPHLWNHVLSAYRLAVQKTAQFPFVLSHGDFNPHNIFERGVIDFGNAHHAPFGYDLVCNIYQEYNFPKIGNYESMRWFEFSEEQIGKYFLEIDDFFERNGLAKLSDFREDFIVFRIIRSTARIGKNTRLGQWRVKKLAKVLKLYLSGASIMDTIVNFS